MEGLDAHFERSLNASLLRNLYANVQETKQSSALMSGITLLPLDVSLPSDSSAQEEQQAILKEDSSSFSFPLFRWGGGEEL